MAEKRCAERVFSGQGWGMSGHPCSKLGKFEHEGNFYCAIHYPPNVEKRTEQQRERWRRESRISGLEWEIQRAERAVVDAAIAWFESEHGDETQAKLGEAVDALLAVRKALQEAQRG